MEPGSVSAQEMMSVAISTMKRINVYQHVIKLELTLPVQVLSMGSLCMDLLYVKCHITSYM